LVPGRLDSEWTFARSGPRTARGRSTMADILYLGVTVAFFGLSWLLVRLCERL
jgi:hypothetical protein